MRGIAELKNGELSRGGSVGWWLDFFDEDYLSIWGASISDERSDAEADGLWTVLQLKEGSRVLDAPCGYGRLTIRLARLGAVVLGVDQAEVMLARARQACRGVERDRIRFVRHDLRLPLGEVGFDAAVNVFSSLGY